MEWIPATSKKRVTPGSEQRVVHGEDDGDTDGALDAPKPHDTCSRAVLDGIQRDHGSNGAVGDGVDVKAR